MKAPLPAAPTGRLLPTVLVVAVVIAVLAAAAVGAVYLAPRLRPPTVALIGLDAPSRAALAGLAAAADPVFRVVDYADWPDWYAAAGRLPPADLVIGADGAALRDEPAAWLDLADAPERTIPAALRAIGRNGDRRYALPLQFDHYEALYNLERLKAAGEIPPVDLPGLEAVAAALAKPGFAPLLAAGGETDAMLRFVGAMVESLGGAEAYWTATAELARAPDLRSALDVELVRRLPLRAVLDRIRLWSAAGWLRADWYRVTAVDCAALLAADACAVAFLDLSFHRTLPTAVAERFAAKAFPAVSAGAKRWLQTTVLVGAVPAGATGSRTGRGFLYRLAGLDAQNRLAGALGLAPAAAAAATADRQASDARFSLAAASGVLVDLGRAVAASAADRAALADRLRDYFAVDGAGY